MNNRGSSLVSTVLAVAAAAGVGVAGYFMLAGNCSSCTTTTADAVMPVAAASAVEGDSCCAGESAEAVVQTVAAVEGESCCAAEAKAECEVVCEDGAEACETACEGAAQAEVPADAQPVSLVTEGSSCSDASAEACSVEKEACTDMTAEACEGKVCPVSGEVIADSGS